MKVVLFDKSEFSVNHEQAARLTKLLQQSTEGYVKINGSTIKKSAIAYIKPGGFTEAELADKNDPNMRLQTDNRSKEDQYKAARKASEIVRENLTKKGILK